MCNCASRTHRKDLWRGPLLRPGTGDRARGSPAAPAGDASRGAQSWPPPQLQTRGCVSSGSSAASALTAVVSDGTALARRVDGQAAGHTQRALLADAGRRVADAVAGLARLLGVRRQLRAFAVVPLLQEAACERVSVAVAVTAATAHLDRRLVPRWRPARAPATRPPALAPAPAALATHGQRCTRNADTHSPSGHVMRGQQSPATFSMTQRSASGRTYGQTRR